MNCANHPDKAAVAFCRACGKPLCESCERPAQGTIFCEEHYVAPAATVPPAASYPPPPAASPYAAGPNPYAQHVDVSPGLAFLLGLIPGVGAIYNGQYAKGIVHALILGVLISLQAGDARGSFAPMIGILIAAFYLYMPFEAYHTAVKRQRGEPVDEFSSVLPLQRRGAAKGFPVGPVLLIALGVLFLLDTMDWVRIHDILRFWPLFLIALGGYMLYLRLTDRDEIPPHEEAGPATGVER